MTSILLLGLSLLVSLAVGKGYPGHFNNIVYYKGQRGEWAKMSKDNLLCGDEGDVFPLEEDFTSAQICDCPCGEPKKEPDWANEESGCRPQLDKYIGLCEVTVPTELSECKGFDYEANNCNYQSIEYQWVDREGTEGVKCDVEYPTEWKDICEYQLMTKSQHCYPDNGGVTEEPEGLDTTSIRYARQYVPGSGYICKTERVSELTLIVDEKDVYFWNITCDKYPGGIFPYTDTESGVPDEIGLVLSPYDEKYNPDEKYKPCQYYYDLHGPDQSQGLIQAATMYAAQNKPVFCYKEDVNGVLQTFTLKKSETGQSALVTGQSCSIYPPSIWNYGPCRECEERNFQAIDPNSAYQVGYCQVCEQSTNPDFVCDESTKVYVRTDNGHSYRGDEGGQYLCDSAAKADGAKCELKKANCDLADCEQVRKHEKKRISWFVFKDGVCLSDPPTPAPTPASKAPSPSPTSSSPTPAPIKGIPPTRSPVEQCICYHSLATITSAKCQQVFPTLEEFKNPKNGEVGQVCICQCRSDGTILAPKPGCHQEYCEGQGQVCPPNAVNLNNCVFSVPGQFSTMLFKDLYRYERECNNVEFEFDWITAEELEEDREALTEFDDKSGYISCGSEKFKDLTNTAEKMKIFARDIKYCFVDMEIIDALETNYLVKYWHEEWGSFTHEIIYPEKFTNIDWQNQKDGEMKGTWTKSVINLRKNVFQSGIAERNKQWYDNIKFEGLHAIENDIYYEDLMKGFHTCYVYPTQDPLTKDARHCQTCVNKHVGFKVYDPKWSFDEVPTQLELYNAFARMSHGYGTESEFTLFGNYQLRPISAYCMGCYWVEEKMKELQLKHKKLGVILTDYKAYHEALKPKNNACQDEHVFHKSLEKDCMGQQGYKKCETSPKQFKEDYPDLEDGKSTNLDERIILLPGHETDFKLGEEKNCYDFKNRTAIIECAKKDKRICAGDFCTPLDSEYPECQFCTDDTDNAYKKDWEKVYCNTAEFGDCLSARKTVTKILRWKKIRVQQCVPKNPTPFPTPDPTVSPINTPTSHPTDRTQPPTVSPTNTPSIVPTDVPTTMPSPKPTKSPHDIPTTKAPTRAPTFSLPTKAPIQPDICVCSHPDLDWSQSCVSAQERLLKTNEFQHCSQKMFGAYSENEFKSAVEALCYFRLQTHLHTHCRQIPLIILGEPMCGSRKLLFEELAFNDEQTTCKEVNIVALTQPAKYEVFKVLVARDTDGQYYGEHPLIDQCCKVCCKKKETCSGHLHLPTCSTYYSRNNHHKHTHHDHWTFHHVLPIGFFLGAVHFLRWFC